MELIGCWVSVRVLLMKLNFTFILFYGSEFVDGINWCCLSGNVNSAMAGGMLKKRLFRFLYCFATVWNMDVNLPLQLHSILLQLGCCHFSNA